MTAHAEDIAKHVRGYFIIGGILLLFTAITVLASYLHLPMALTVIVALIIATFKASLVGLYFMHLISEKKLIYWALVLTAIFFLALMFLPVITANNHYGAGH